ncbi:universal stress protein [Nocardioides zhouii]|uniref:Universal stress protein n=1 Tax=Nocardioides zhouii TaxID=1168729 RepID=A0A4V1RQS4_9ACTN|nr:universal stress protein [Nocardioides zhouii]RYC13867.1 universal stress protein [Nocardioides zhouii]
MNSIGTETIVVGIDGSANSDAALDWAVDAASLQGLRLHVFSAGVHGSHGDDPDAGFVDAMIAREARAVADKNLAAAKLRAAERSPGLVVTTHSDLEPAARSLVAYSSDAHSIVLGRSGHNAWTGSLLGAVASKVVSQAVCPVAVVRGPTRATSTAHGVAVAIDGSSTSKVALAHAFHHASLRGVDLRVIHASWTRATVSRTPDTRADQVNQEAILVSEALAGWAERYPDVSVEVSLPVGPTVLAITGAARDAELLVMGCRRHGLPRVLLGSVSRGVLKHAPCTVLIVRERVEHPGPTVTFGSVSGASLATR